MQTNLPDVGPGALKNRQDGILLSSQVENERDSYKTNFTTNFHSFRRKLQI